MSFIGSSVWSAAVQHRGRRPPKQLLKKQRNTWRTLRVAEVEQLDIRVQENKVVEYRARVRASFRYHPEKH
jgi:flavin-binding protein dodecin